jgi:hypothetical protein
VEERDKKKDTKRGSRRSRRGIGRRRRTVA